MGKFNYDNIPSELKRLKNWVCWTVDKIPKNPNTGGNSMSNNKSTWGTYTQAIEACKKYGFDGIGFMFTPPYFGVDLDKCVDKTDFVDEFVDTLGSYTEYSKSGLGIHIICKGELPAGSRRKENVEMYDSGRFFIMTGNVYGDLRPIAECSETIKILHQKHLATPQSSALPKQYEKITMSDGELIDKARQAKNGIYFQALYEGSWQGAYSSQSEADLAFAHMLAFWTQRNYDQMDRIFRNSGLMRPKWDRKQSGTTYGSITLDKAIAGCNDVYQYSTPIEKTIVQGDATRAAGKPTKSYDYTDTGNGQRFADTYENVIRYSGVHKRWYFWDGKRWAQDTTNEIRRLADTVLVQMKLEAFSEEDELKQKEALKNVNRTASKKGKDSMIAESQHLRKIAIAADYFDQQKDMINLANGVVNLRNGELTPHDSSLNMSRIGYAEIDPDPEKKPERWLQFLDEITGGDKELQRYLQKAVGYSMGASIREQCLFFCYGNGCNGKSTFVDVISTMMGTYGMNMQAESIMQRKNSSAINTDIARLKGARFVTVPEPEEGGKLSESLVKQLTGGDVITARFLFGDEFEFRPEFKMWICTNHKPVIQGTDDGIWRRVVLIPFTVTIPPEKIDRNLSYKLRKELPQITRWAVEGAIAWHKEGLTRPECISKATADYRAEMDVLCRFVEDCIIESNSEFDSIKAAQLYDVYEKWATDTNEYIHTSTRFGRDFAVRFPTKIKKMDGWYYKYCKLTDYAIANYKTDETYEQSTFKGYYGKQKKG